jgi:hypothetical protein
MLLSRAAHRWQHSARLFPNSRSCSCPILTLRDQGVPQDLISSNKTPRRQLTVCEFNRDTYHRLIFMVYLFCIHSTLYPSADIHTVYWTLRLPLRGEAKWLLRNAHQPKLTFRSTKQFTPKKRENTKQEDAISGSHGGEYDDDCLLRCCSLSFRLSHKHFVSISHLPDDCFVPGSSKKIPIRQEKRQILSHKISQAYSRNSRRAMYRNNLSIINETEEIKLAGHMARTGAMRWLYTNFWPKNLRRRNDLKDVGVGVGG